MDIRSQIVETFNQVGQEQGREVSQLTDNLQLLESGLDSLCFAIVITRLEDSLGVDPFLAENAIFPVTFGEFVSCYESVPK